MREGDGISQRHTDIDNGVVKARGKGGEEWVEVGKWWGGGGSNRDICNRVNNI